MMSQLMLGDANRDWSRRTMFQVPLIASFLMVAWNLSSDPLLSTLRQAWIWRDGGSYFGVPVINFFSLVSYDLHLLPALLVLSCQNSAAKNPGLAGVLVSAGDPLWLNRLYADADWSICASAGSVSDPAGMVWSVHQIYAVCALVCTFTMGAFTVLAFLNVSRIPASR